MVASYFSSSKQSSNPETPNSQLNVNFIQQSLSMLGFPAFPFHSTGDVELASQIMASLLQTRQVIAN